MAIMIPSTLDDDNNIGEKLVFDKLRSMPGTDKWVVRSNLRTSFVNVSGSKRCLIETESDFVVLIPEKGLVFLEVKGTRFYSCSQSESCDSTQDPTGYICQDGEWFRCYPGKKAKTDNPFKQVWDAKHNQMVALWAAINSSNGEDYKQKFPGVYAHLVVYPRGEILPPRRFPFQAPCLVVTQKDMPNLKKKIEDVVNLYPQAQPMPDEIFKKIVEYFKEEVHIAAVKSDPETLETEIAKLTERQKEAAGLLLKTQNCRVIGCCGSGKTVLSLWLLKHKAQHHNVLFLCFNRMLAASLCIKTEEHYEIKTINQLIYSLASSAGIIYDPDNLENTFYRAIEKLDHLGKLPQYDVIIIDEAQDIPDEIFNALEWLKKANCSMYVFVDPKQNLYQQKQNQNGQKLRSYAVWKAEEVILDKNCRNTKRIAKYVSNLGDVETSVFEDAPEGRNPFILPVRPNPFDLLSNTVNNLLNNKDYPWPVSSIAILVSTRDDLNDLEDKTFYNNIGTVVYHSETSNVDSLKELLRTWYSGKKILVSTIQAFKGMEADIVIIYKYDSSLVNNVANAYVGVSRPRGALYIIPKNDKSSKFVSQYLPKEGEME